MLLHNSPDNHQYFNAITFSISLSISFKNKSGLLNNNILANDMQFAIRILLNEHSIPILIYHQIKSNNTSQSAVHDCRKGVRYRLSPYASVFTAQLFVIAWAIDFAENANYDNFVLLSDSHSALQTMKSYKTTSHEDLDNIINELHASMKSYSLIWVPGY